MGKKKTAAERWRYQFFQVYLKLAGQLKRAPGLYELAKAGFPGSTIRDKLGNLSRVYNLARREYPARMLGIPFRKPTDSTPKKEELARTYAKKFKELGRVPSYTECGISDKTTCRLFGSQEGLHKYAREHFPGSFFDVEVESLNTRSHLEQIAATLQEKKRFIITTAVEGVPAHVPFLKSIQNYCDQKDAALLVLLCSDPASRNFGTQIDAKIAEYGSLILKDTALNDNLFLSTIKVSAKQIEPLTGLLRIGQRDGSMILASPKQQLKLVATSNVKLPHALMTTGACTVPNYDTEMYMSERTAYIALHDHVIGGIVVEIEDDKVFHFRQIQADSKGRFADLGVMYTPDGSVCYPPEALVPGDWHTQSTDPEIRGIFFNSIYPELKPSKIFLHDFFDGISVNHHERKSLIVRAQRAESGQLSLLDEISCLTSELQDFCELPVDIFIVKSNHDIFLDRYLADGLHIKDPQNVVLGGVLLNAAIRGQDPLMTGVNLAAGQGSKLERVIWLGFNDDVKIGGVQMAAHGHLGPNGTRNPALKEMEKAYGQCMVGHSHTPEIIRGAWRVGTMSKLRLGYNDGPSSWLHCVGLVYPNGARQLVNIINGKWRL